MRVGTVIGLGLALGSTTLISFSYLRAHGAVAELPPLSLRRPLRSAQVLLTSRDWLAGFAMESGGFALYVAALALAPLALVQSVAAGRVGILAVATARIAHRRLTRRERAGAALAGTSLLQVGYQSGSASTVAGLATLLTNAIPIAAGAVVLHERIPNGPLGAIRVLAFGAVTAVAILLARPERR